MAGFRDFQTGEVLTAANVNDFLSKQSVMKFADSSARDTALGTAVGGANALREGMASYLDDTDSFEIYNGTAWNSLGGLVDVKSALFTGTQTGSLTAGNNFAVTDLSITHEVAEASNKLIISAFFGQAGTSSGYGNLGIAVHDGTSLIAIGDADGSRTRVTAGGNVDDGGATYIVTMPSVTFVHTPGVGSKTYTVRAINIMSATRTLYINRSEDDTDTGGRSRAVSSLVIQEVKV